MTAMEKISLCLLNLTFAIILIGSDGRIDSLEAKLQSKDQQCEWCMAKVEKIEGKR